MGRVLLLDVSSMTFIRLWKGYRGAVCMWTMAHPDPPAHAAQPALFIVLYAAKRGLLEVWPAPFGARVAAFNVGEGSVLIPVPTTTAPTETDPANYDCCIMRPNGTVMTLSVPFACALKSVWRTCAAWPTLPLLFVFQRCRTLFPSALQPHTCGPAPGKARRLQPDQAGAEQGRRQHVLERGGHGAASGRPRRA